MLTVLAILFVNGQNMEIDRNNGSGVTEEQAGLDDWCLGLTEMGFCIGISGRICQAFSMVFGIGQRIGR